MNSEQSDMENELFYVPEDGFWQGRDKLAFETQNLEGEWPKPSNPFVHRMASSLGKDRGLHNVAVCDFKQLIGALVEKDAVATYRFMIIPMGSLGRTLSVCLIETLPTALPPLRSDNACSLQLAIEWMAKTHDYFEMSCAAEGSYWVHKR